MFEIRQQRERAKAPTQSRSPRLAALQPYRADGHAGSDDDPVQSRRGIEHPRAVRVRFTSGKHEVDDADARQRFQMLRCPAVNPAAVRVGGDGADEQNATERHNATIIRRFQPRRGCAGVRAAKVDRRKSDSLRSLSPKTCYVVGPPHKHAPCHGSDATQTVEGDPA